MRKRGLIFLTVIMLAFMTACTDRQAEDAKEGKPVNIMALKEETNSTVLEYTGVVNSRELRKMAFKSPGRIRKIHVEKGQRVKRGDTLAELDTTDLEYALEASKAQMEAARSTYQKALNGATAGELKNAEINVKKAQDVYNNTLDTYKKMEILYDNGAISKQDIDRVKLELEIRESELEQAQEILNQLRDGVRDEDRQALLNQFKQAEADYEYKAGLLEDAFMKADMDGFIADILYREGEMAQAGYPVIVMGSDELIVSVGIAEEDLNKVMHGAKSVIKVDGIETEGVVVNISKIPDAATRTYNAEISFKKESISVGAVVKVDITVGEEKGIWIPITAIISEGADYVYLVRDGTALKREVSVQAVTGSKVRVTGLEEGESLITEGMRKLKAGERVTILE